MLQRFSHFYAGTGRGSALVRALVGSMGLRLVGMGFGFLVGVQLARGLGPSDYGVYGLAMSVVALLMVPTEFGIPQLVTREVAASHSSGDDSMLPRLLRWSAQFVVVNTLLVGGIAAAVIGLNLVALDPELKSSLWWGLLLIPVVASSNILSAALRGLHRIVEGQVAELLIRPAALSAMLMLFLSGLVATPLTPSLAMALNVLAASLGAAFVIKRLRPVLRLSIPQAGALSVARGWLKSAGPLALSDGMRILSGHLAILVLGAMASTEEVGLYRVAFGIYTMATLPSALLNVACSPMLAALHEEGNAAAMQRLNGWMSLALVASSVAFILPFAAFDDQILSFIFGRSYSEAGPVLLVLLAGEVVSGLLGHPTIVLNMIRRDRIVMVTSFLALAMNIGLCVVLAPSFGGVGAAIGVSIAQIAWRGMASRYAWKTLGLHTSVLAWLPRKREGTNP